MSPKPTAAEWLALWSSVQKFAGSIPARGLGVCCGSESILNCSPGLAQVWKKVTVERQTKLMSTNMTSIN